MATKPKVITTRQGDTWDILAKTLYGDEHYMDVLIKANIHFRKTTIFSAGVVLNVPAIDTRSKKYAKGLPPWVRIKEG